MVGFDVSSPHIIIVIIVSRIEVLLLLMVVVVPTGIAGTTIAVTTLLTAPGDWSLISGLVTVHGWITFVALLRCMPLMRLQLRFSLTCLLRLRLRLPLLLFDSLAYFSLRGCYDLPADTAGTG